MCIQLTPSVLQANCVTQFQRGCTYENCFQKAENESLHPTPHHLCSSIARISATWGDYRVIKIPTHNRNHKLKNIIYLINFYLLQ
jgi:hypothetical protein